MGLIFKSLSKVENDIPSSLGKLLCDMKLACQFKEGGAGSVAPINQDSTLYNDLDIFWASLATHLDQFERVEANDGYVGEAPLRVKCPACVTTQQEKHNMMKRVWVQQETINRRFKQWQILKQVFRHDIRVHRDVFAAISVITQLVIENGELLFSVQYSDE